MEEIIQILTKNKETISTMESCTGGLLANTITNVPGASAVFNFGAVTYSNDFKIKLGVKKEVIDKYSVYSRQTAEEMSKNIALFSGANYGVGITGKLLKSDPFNKEGQDNKVFICLYKKATNTFYHQEVIVDQKTRIENKKLVIEAVIKLLKEIIK